MQEERAFKGVWIPAEIWLNGELTIYEKAIYAEIDSLDGEKHCWASNEYLADFCQMSIPTISRAITHLIELGLIERVNFDGRQRILKVTNESRLISEISLPNQSDKADLSPSEFLLYNRKNNKENSREAPVPVLSENTSKNPRRNFRTEHEELKDDLYSGKEIDEQKAKKKKSPAEKLKDNCLDEIEKRNFDEETKELLKEYFTWASSGKDSRRIKSLDLWISKLNALEQIAKKSTKGIKAIVQQSIDNKWYKFVDVEEVIRNNKKPLENFTDTIKVTSKEEALAAYEDKIRRGIKSY